VVCDQCDLYELTAVPAWSDFQSGVANLALLFDVTVYTINEHLNSIYESGELIREANIRKFRLVQREGSRDVSGIIDYYNLDAVISVEVPGITRSAAAGFGEPDRKQCRSLAHIGTNKNLLSCMYLSPQTPASSSNSTRSPVSGAAPLGSPGGVTSGTSGPALSSWRDDPVPPAR
jgi:hypothetical protein